MRQRLMRTRNDTGRMTFGSCADGESTAPSWRPGRSASHAEYVSSKEALRQLIDPDRQQLDSRAGVWRGMLQMRGQAIVMLGLLLLIATPVMRVAASIFIFARERDRLYIAITTLVLLLLLTSFFLGAHA